MERLAFFKENSLFRNFLFSVFGWLIDRDCFRSSRMILRARAFSLDSLSKFDDSVCCLSLEFDFETLICAFEDRFSLLL